MNCIHQNKKHCSDNNLIENLPPPINLNPSNVKHPFANSCLRNIPIVLLKHMIVSYLSFEEQSKILAVVSKAFNELATFAREEQDWRDHPISVYDSKCFPLKKYLQWQKNKNILDLDTSGIFYKVFCNKLNFITKLEQLQCDEERDPDEDNDLHIKLYSCAQKEFFYALASTTQTKIKKLWIGMVNFKNFNFELELVSNKCPELENLEIDFSNEEEYKEKNPFEDHLAVEWNILPKSNGLIHIFRKCYKVKLQLNLYYLKNVAELTQISQECNRLNVNFPLYGLNVQSIELDEKWGTLLGHCSQLKYVKFTNIWGVITEDFLKSLSGCTQLNTIDFHTGVFQFIPSLEKRSNPYYRYNPKEKDLLALKDITFSSLIYSCHQLTEFNFVNQEPLGDAFFDAIISHPNIEKIYISISLSTQILERTTICTSLKEITLSCKVNDDENPIEKANYTTKAVAKFFPNLTLLEIYNFPLYSDEAILPLANLAFIEKIYLGETDKHLSAKSMMSLANCTSLKTLSFNVSNDPVLSDFFSVLDDPVSSDLISIQENFFYTEVIKYPNFTNYDYKPKKYLNTLV